MDITQIEAFVQVVRKGSISAAAEALHLTQPAVSGKIRSLENSLGVELVHRSNRGVVLTDAGKTALSHALKILKDCHDLTARMDIFKERIAGSLSVGATTTIGGYALPCSIFVFQEKYPGAHVNVRVSNTADVIHMVRNGEADIGLVEGVISDPVLVTKGIAEDELLLVAPPDFAGRQTITLNEFTRLPCIMREHGSGTRQTVEEALRLAGLSLSNCKVVLELDSIDAIKAAVEAGRGVSILSSLAIRKEIRIGTLVSLRIEGLSLKRQFNLVTLKGRAMNALEREFVSFIRTPSRRQFC